MRTRRSMACLLLLALTSGCGSDAEPAAPTYRTLADFSSLNLSPRSLIEGAPLPGAPKGFSDRDVELLAGMLKPMARRGTYDPDVWHLRSQRAAIDRVFRDLDPEVRQSMDRAARDQLDGRPWATLAGTVFAHDVTVVGRPLMQRATWDVDVGHVDGAAWLGVRLQTRTFYAVRHRDRRTVIAATHTWGLSSPGPVDSFHPSPELASEAVGGEACAFILRGVITPETDKARYVADMRKVMRGPSATFVEPSGDNGAATAEACRADGS